MQVNSGKKYHLEGDGLDSDVNAKAYKELLEEQLKMVVKSQDENDPLLSVVDMNTEVVMKVCKPGLTDMTLVDLPGLPKESHDKRQVT